jgi:DNA-binding XRE family transcriptional regulator
LAGILGAEKSTKEEIEMAFAAWWGILNLVLTVALLAAVVYLFVLIVQALKKYIGSKEVRAEKRAAKRTLGETLKAHRIQCHMTQEFVAESLGVSRQTVSKWENGSADPSTTNLLAVAKLYDVPAEELLREVER